MNFTLPDGTYFRTGNRTVEGCSEDAFRKVYNRYFPKLVNFAASYLIVRDEAADIVQTVFLSLWDKRESLAKNTNLNNYLITLTRNQSLNHLRHNRAGMNYQS